MLSNTEVVLIKIIRLRIYQGKGGVKMKKLLAFCMVASVLFLFGCGPKGASQETLSALSMRKQAVESAETKLKELEAKRLKLEEKKAEKEARAEELRRELENLKIGGE